MIIMIKNDDTSNSNNSNTNNDAKLNINHNLYAQSAYLEFPY